MNCLLCPSSRLACARRFIVIQRPLVAALAPEFWS